MLNAVRVLSLLVLLTGSYMSCKEPNIEYLEGGHNFPTTIRDEDTNYYFYPYKNLGTLIDSFADGELYRFYRAFDEENLSIQPYNGTIFRFTYDGWSIQPVIITLTNNEITVKKGSSSVFIDEDTNRLTKIEKLHYRILQRFFPLSDTTRDRNRKRRYYLDSLVHVYPQLLSPTYYHSLIDKVYVPTKPPFTYTTNRIPISPDTFRYLVNQFYNAGFWKLPYHMSKDCDMTDGYGFSIEANNGKKYQCVHISGCYDDTTRITNACQELVKYAKADDQIQLIWEGTTEMIPAD